MTYCASRLPPELLAATEVMIVTCESNPAEVEALRAALRHVPAGRSGARGRMLGHLPIGQAVALPITEEAGGELRLFTIGAAADAARAASAEIRRRAGHRRPRVRVLGQRPRRPPRARTLRQFVDALEGTRRPAARDGYLRRGDFSRWIGDVFGDHALADELRVQEQRYVRGEDRDTLPEIAAAVRARYDLTEDDESPPSGR